MKQSPTDRRVLERMAPGALCRDGFLGSDRRAPWEIVAADSSVVDDLGLTHGEIADRLDDVVAAAMAHMGAPVAVAEHALAVYRESMGRIPSPWPGDGIFPKGDVELTTPDGGTLRFTALSIHLIRAHGFYQGRGSPYRLEPAALADLFGL